MKNFLKTFLISISFFGVDFAHAQSNTNKFTPPRFDFEGGIETYMLQKFDDAQIMIANINKDAYSASKFTITSDGTIQFVADSVWGNNNDLNNKILQYLKEGEQYFKMPMINGNKVALTTYVYFDINYDSLANKYLPSFKLDYDLISLSSAYMNEGTKMISEMKYDEAITLFYEVYYTNINDMTAYYNIGLCKLKLGDTLSACAYWKETRKYNSAIANPEIYEYCSAPNSIIEERMAEIKKDENSRYPEQVFTIVEHMPDFIGGEKELKKFVQTLFHYPNVEKEKNIGGTVYVTFIVMPDGSMNDLRIVRGIAGAPFLDQEVIRLVRQMPKWNPGSQSGKIVPVQFNLPIKCSPITN